MVDQETALGKALFLFNQGLAVAEIWMSIAKANAKALELSPATMGQPWIGINTAIGAAQTALALSQVVQAFSKSSSDTGYSQGGFTTQGNKDEPAGIVHKSEYVINKEMLANPQVRYIADMLENMRTRKVSLNSQAFPMLKSGGFATTNKTSSSASQKLIPGSSDFIVQQNQINRELTAAIRAFMEHRPPVAIETIERELKKYNKQKLTQGL
jgi:hypothetical protein